MTRKLFGILFLTLAMVAGCEPAYAQTAAYSFTQLGASGASTAGGTLTESLAAPSGGQTVYLERFDITCAAPAALESGVVQVTGLAIGTLKYTLNETAAGGGALNISFPMPEAASAQNTAINVVLPAISSGSICQISVVGRQI
jgi:hypothetical protein